MTQDSIDKPTCETQSYPEWPCGLGDPYVVVPDPKQTNKQTQQDRQEVIAQFRARRSVGKASTTPKRSQLREYEATKFSPRYCSFQTHCRHALAMKQCYNCIKFDEKKVGYYCDACFEAHHPPYRMPHSWIPIEENINQEQEWVVHVTSHKLQQDASELKLLLDETHQFLLKQSNSSLSEARSRLLNVPRTSVGGIDFKQAFASISTIQGTLHELLAQVQIELAQKPPLTREEALIKIQTMWKLRKARKQLKALVRTVYESFQDPATGETYYYNTQTKTTQWTKPKALGSEELLVENPTMTKKVTKKAINLSPNDAARSIQGMVRCHEARKLMRKYISSVYEKIWDSTTERFYYHNTQTKQVKWEKPRWVNDEDLCTPRSHLERLEQEKADEKARKLQELARTLTDEQAAILVQRAYRRKSGFQALLRLCRVVYERIYDPVQGAYYYYNTRTKETTWEKPLLLRGGKEDVFTPRTREKQLQKLLAQTHKPRKQWTQEEAAVRLQGLFRARKAKVELDTRLAQVYKKVKDPSSDQFYYFNEKTGAVSWEPPALLLRSNVQVAMSVKSIPFSDDIYCVTIDQLMPPVRLLLLLLLHAALHEQTLLSVAALDGPDEAYIDYRNYLDDSDSQLEATACELDEIELASDGTIKRKTLKMGERVASDAVLNGTLEEDEYRFYHLCIVRHDHEHQINIQLQSLSGDANLYLSSEHRYPRKGHATWISQHPGNDFVKLYTYLDGFPRKHEAQNHSIPLHVGVVGVSSNSATYNLSISVIDIATTSDIQSREKFYTQQHIHDRSVQREQRRRLRSPDL